MKTLTKKNLVFHMDINIIEDGSNTTPDLLILDELESYQLMKEHYDELVLKGDLVTKRPPYGKVQHYYKGVRLLINEALL